MVEEKKMDYSVGHIRIKYLDLANMAFAAGNYTGCNRFLKNFLDTVDEKSDAGKRIKDEFDGIVGLKKLMLKQLEESKKSLGYLEARDVEKEGRDEIEINSVHDMKEACWRISLLYKLFEDDEKTK